MALIDNIEPFNAREGRAETYLERGSRDFMNKTDALKSGVVTALSRKERNSELVSVRESKTCNLIDRDYEVTSESN